jgi:hypothetical protein
MRSSTPPWGCCTTDVSEGAVVDEGIYIRPN